MENFKNLVKENKLFLALIGDFLILILTLIISFIVFSSSSHYFVIPDIVGPFIFQFLSSLLYYKNHGKNKNIRSYFHVQIPSYSLFSYMMGKNLYYKILNLQLFIIIMLIVTIIKLLSYKISTKKTFNNSFIKKVTK